MKHLSPQFVDEIKQRLIEEKERLQQELSALLTHTELGDDMDASAQEIQLDEVNRDISFRLNDDLSKVMTALRKIEEGTYGIDEDGNEISEARLRALPWADKAL